MACRNKLWFWQVCAGSNAGHAMPRVIIWQGIDQCIAYCHNDSCWVKSVADSGEMRHDRMPPHDTKEHCNKTQQNASTRCAEHRIEQLNWSGPRWLHLQQGPILRPQRAPRFQVLLGVRSARRQPPGVPARHHPSSGRRRPRRLAQTRMAASSGGSSVGRPGGQGGQGGQGGNLT